MASVERFLPRPEIVTVLMLALFYQRLQDGRYQAPRDLLLLGLAQVAWTNSHGLFPLGPFLVGIYWLGSVIDWIRDKSGDLVPLTRLSLVVLLASICSPFGLTGWRYALLLFEEAGTDRPPVFASLGELSATFGAAFRESPAFWFYSFALAGAIAAVVYGFSTRAVSPRLWIVVAMGLLSLTGRRNVVLFVVVAVPFLAETLYRLAGPKLRLPRAATIVAAILILAGSWYPLSGAFYLAFELPTRAGLGVTPSFFPHRLPAMLEESGFEGRILNSNTLGGFYLYHGYPDRLPLTDGRWEIYDREDLSFILTSGRRPGEWRQVVERYDLEGILLAHTSPEAEAILPEISHDAAWRLVFLDRAASFWAPSAGFHALQTARLAGGEDLPDIDRVEDGILLNAFLAGVGAQNLQVLNLERTLAFGRRTEFLLEQLGGVLRDIGRFDEADEAFSRLLEWAPENLEALNELAFLAFREGDLTRARDLMLRALELDPGNERMRENLERVETQLGVRN